MLTRGSLALRCRLCHAGLGAGLCCERALRTHPGCAVLCCVVLCRAVSCCVVLCCAVLYPSTAKVWQTLNIGKSPRVLNNLIISGAVHGQMRGHCLGVVCQTLPVLRYCVALCCVVLCCAVVCSGVLCCAVTAALRKRPSCRLRCVAVTERCCVVTTVLQCVAVTALFMPCVVATVLRCVAVTGLWWLLLLPLCAAWCQGHAPVH